MGFKGDVLKHPCTCAKLCLDYVLVPAQFLVPLLCLARVVHPLCVSVQSCHGAIEEVVSCLSWTPLPRAQVVPGLPPPAGLAELPPSTLLLARSKLLPPMSTPPPSTTPPECR